MQNPFQPDNRNLEELVIRRSPDSISTELDNETVILNIATGIYSGLDQVGTTVWNRLEKPATFKVLVEAILQDFEVNRSQCVDDLCVFLQDLLSNNLIEIGDGQTG